MKRLIDYYRCPEELLRVAPAEDLSKEPCPFSFGGAKGWGQLSASVRRNGDFWNDASAYAASRGNTLYLPFDLTHAVENLLFERYISRIPKTSSFGHPYLLDLYCFFRPFLPAVFRRFEHRVYFWNRDARKFPRWPLDCSVDELLEEALLSTLRLGLVKEIPFVWFWPEAYSSCVILTHDVETEKGRDYCPELMDIDESAGVPSSFQLIPEERYSLLPSFLAAMRERGFEINVHDLNHDGKLFAEQARFIRRAAEINRHAKNLGAKGFRSAVLYRNQDWFNAFDFEYDMSVPNAGHFEVQFGGCCTVMPYWVQGIVELPLTTVQDYVLFTLRGDYSLDLWKKQVELIRQKNGLISFLTHPDYLQAPRARCGYELLLDYIRSLSREGNAWLALPGQVNTWWRERSQMKVVRHGLSWRIEGRGAERARLAYARLKNNCLVYEMATNADECTRHSVQ